MDLFLQGFFRILLILEKGLLVKRGINTIFCLKCGIHITYFVFDFKSRILNFSDFVKIELSEINEISEKIFIDIGTPDKVFRRFV